MREQQRVLTRSGSKARALRVALIFALLPGIPATAAAHGGLKKSTPARGEVVTTPVRELRLEFSEKPELVFTSVQLTGPGETSIAVGTPALTDNTLVVSLDAALLPGTYKVLWKTAGKDGHPVRGQYTFSVATTVAPWPATTGGGGTDSSSATAAMAPMEMHQDPASLPEGRSFDAGSPIYVAIRWFQLIALVILIGAFAFWYAVLGALRRNQPDSPLPGATRDGVAEIARWAAAALVALAIIRLFAQSYAMHGETQSVVGAMLPMITSTTWGTGWLLQLAGCTVVLAGLGIARRSPGKGWGVAAIGAVAVAFSPAFSGHAASSPHLTTLAVVADAIHVIGASGWLGSLLFVLVVGVPAAMRLDEGQRGAGVSSLVNAFSPTALVFAGIAATTGIFAAWLHIGSISGLYETGYGRTLLLKLGVLSVVAATGAYNWLRVKPALGKPEATNRLKRSATMELVVAVIVLAVTAVLVATPTAIDEKLMRPTTSSATSR